MKALKKLILIVTKAELSISAVTFAIMVVCYFISVINRNIIKQSMPWTEELALYSMVYMALLGTELGLRDGTQVRVTALVDKFEGTSIGRILDLVANTILIVFIFIMMRYGIALVGKQIQTGQMSPVLHIPMFALYLSLVISFGITLLTQTLIIIGKIFKIDMKDITNVDAIIDTFGAEGGD